MTDLAALKSIIEALEALDQRVTQLEGAQRADARPGPSRGSVAAGAPDQDKSIKSGNKLRLHPSTRRAMRDHTPELTQQEVCLWLKRFQPGRRYKRGFLQREYFPKDADSRQKAQRVLFWLRHMGYMEFNEKTFEYRIRVSPNTV